MAFSDLDSTLQTIMLENFSYNAKWISFFLITFLAYYYVFVYWKELKQTIFWTSLVFRVMTYFFCMAWLVFSPVTLLIMTPEYGFYDFISIPLILYGIMVGIMGIVAFHDVFKYGIIGIMEFGGFDTNNKDIKRLVTKMKTSKMMIKRSNRGW